MNAVFSHEPTNKTTLENITNALPTYLTDKRLTHTLGVQKQALELSKIYFPLLNVDEKYKSDISCASLVHDLTKKFSLDEQQALCKKYNITTDVSTYNSCALLHSKTSAYLSKDLFDINDYVFNAVFFHTTGKPDMNIFEKIVFISDYIEPNRTQKECVDTRNFFYENLDKTNNKLLLLDKVILMSLDNTLSYLSEGGNTIDMQTVSARNYLLQAINN